MAKITVLGNEISHHHQNEEDFICLTDMVKNLNALFINENLSQTERLIKLNKIAIQQMRLLTEDKIVKKLESKGAK